MGADIHMVLERRSKIRGLLRWVGVNAFPYVVGTIYDFSGRKDNPEAPVSFTGSVSWAARDRNYDLFAALAGVRGEGQDPRGVPDDVSDLAAMEIERWDADGHSHSWMTMDEALPIFLMSRQFGTAEKAVLDAFKVGTSHALDNFMRYFWTLEDDEDLTDYRLVFWFDN